MSTKAVDYSSYTLISCCACVIYYLVLAVLTRWLLSVRALLVEVVLAQERRLFCWKYFEEVCTVKIAVKRRLNLKLVVSFVGRSSHTMEWRAPCTSICSASTLLRWKVISQEQEYGLKSEVKMCAWSSVHTSMQILIWFQTSGLVLNKSISYVSY